MPQTAFKDGVKICRYHTVMASALPHTIQKHGFNLIEIAIVLAVIGLVIGGIYTAAAAVTEQNRQQKTQKQILQISRNVRSLYATQAEFIELNYEQMKATGIIPADLSDSGSNFINPYGGGIHLADGASTGYGNDTFFISFYNVPQAACINILVKTYGSGRTAAQDGLIGAGTWPNHYVAGAALSNGISLAEAEAVCDNTSPAAPDTNELCFIFNLH